jgi:hypothetical protein
MTKPSEQQIAPAQAELVSASLVEKDLSVSWDTIGSEYNWYRVESYCTPVECELMGVNSDRCPSMTVVSTVAARNLEDLCATLTSPSLNPPMRAKILSVQSYSRSLLKQNNSPDQCNVLEELEFCQIPECQDFCVDTGSSFVNSRNLADQESPPKPGFWDTRTSAVRRKVFNHPPRVSESKPSLDNSLFSLEGESFSYEGSGGVETSGSSYVTSPFWSFIGSGSAYVFGSLFMSFEHESEGSASISGSALDLRASFVYLPSGSVMVFGSACCASPSYEYVGSGGIHLHGSVESPVVDMGVFVVQMEAGAFAFDLGYEYTESSSLSPLSISDFTVSACGCQLIGPIVFLRHNLQKSEFFSEFLSSGGLSFPQLMSMRYREDDSSWRFLERMSGKAIDLAVSSTLQCLSDVWRLDFGVDDGVKRTRIILDMPFDMICTQNMKSTSMLFYFSSFVSEVGSGERIPATNPVRSRSLQVYGKVDSFVDGIFVPETVYYDGLGIFADSYWSYAPLELEINPPSRRGTKTVDLSWVI